MKKFIPNPEYDNAHYEMSVVPMARTSSHRFNTYPSLEIQRDNDLMAEFLKNHSIPQYICVDE